MLVLALLACVGATPAHAARLYVGAGQNYSISLESEAGQAHVLELSARASCQYSEGQPLPPTFQLSAFPAPRKMRVTSHGFSASESTSIGEGRTEAHVLASFSGGEVTGAYRLEYHEESIDCESSYGWPQPFEARRYLPIGGPRTVAPVRGEPRVFYDHGGSTRFFARATPTRVTGLRGVIRSRCPIRRNPSRDRPLPLFPRGANATLEGGRFVRLARDNGLMLYSGLPYVETIAISGRETKEALTGTYLRVHTIKPPGSKPRRCVTGPLPIEDRRYLPARR